MRIKIESELEEYTTGGIEFKVGQILRLNDIASELVHEIKDWSWYGVPGSKELKNLLYNKTLDFKDIFFCYTDEEDESVLQDNCSKLFSLSLFKLTKIFKYADDVYFLLNRNLICRLGNNQPSFNPYEKELDQWQKAFFAKDSDVLSQITEQFENETKYKFITERERINAISLIYCAFYLVYFKIKYNVPDNGSFYQEKLKEYKNPMER